MQWGKNDLGGVQRNAEMPTRRGSKIEEKKKFKSSTASAFNNTNGAWSSVIQMPLVAAAAQRPDGKIVYWSAKDKLSFGGQNGRTWTSTFDPAPNTAVEAVTEGINSSQPVQHDDYFPWLWVAPNGNLFHAGPK